MPKPFYFLVGIEEIAVGAWMRRNAEMPGVLTIEPQLDRKPAAGATAPALPGSNGHGNLAQTVLAMLLEGPKRASEIAATIGGSKSRAYGALNQLSKKRLAKSTNNVWHATAHPGEVASRTPLLPAPAKSAAGRAKPGETTKVVLAALAAAPLRPMDIAAKLAAAGLGSKSTSGVLDRGKRDGIIKRNSDGLYELTAKGRKSAEGAEAHG